MDAALEREGKKELMRIVLTKRAPFSVPDGISHFLFSLANELGDLGHEVIGLTTREPSPNRVSELFRYPNLPAIRSLTETDGKGYGFEFGTWLKRGSQVLTELQPDLVLVNGAVPCRYSCPSVTIAHDVDRRSLGSWDWSRRIYKAITYRATDHLVTTCSELVNEVATDALFPASKIKVIPTCITPELYRPRPISERRPAIVHIGMQEYKNPLASIRAFLPFADRARLIVVGRIYPEIQTFIGSLSSSQRSSIELPGIVSDEALKDYLETARAISVPSIYKAPVASPTVLEAFATHTPVVGSSSISRDLLTPGVNGFLADEELGRQDAFDQLLSDDLLWCMLSEGAAAAVKRFSASRVAEQYLKLIGSRNETGVPVHST